MPDKGAVRRIGASFAQIAEENLRRRTSGTYVQQINIIIVPNWELHRGTENGSINVVRDVIDATCMRWVRETIVSRSVIFTRVTFMHGDSSLLVPRINHLGESQRKK